MRRLTIRLAALTAAGALALAGCTGASDPTPGPTTAPTTDGDGTSASAPPADDTGSTTGTVPGTAAPEVELEVPYPAPSDVARVLPEGDQTLSTEDGHEFTLTGVHRLADDRV